MIERPTRGSTRSGAACPRRVGLVDREDALITIGVAEWVLERRGPAALDRAAQLGLGAIHVDAGAPGRRYHVGERAVRRAYREVASVTGVAIVGLSAGAVDAIGVLGPRTGLATRRCRDVVRGASDAAAELGAPIVCVPSVRRSEIRSADDLARTAEFLREACEHAEKNDVGLATKNTLGGSGNRALFAAVGHPRLSLLVDPHDAARAGHDPAELVELMAERLCGLVHVQHGRDPATPAPLLGEGDAPLRETLEALVAARFSGHVILANDYTVDAKQRVERDLEALGTIFGT